jgi:hypothetical protein
VDIFEWHFPTAPDPVFSASENTLRWKSSYGSLTGKLDFSVDSGSTWQSISSFVDLSKGFYSWTPPSVILPALLKMSISTKQIVSDTFIISSRTQIGIGFNCPDSFMFYWNKLSGVNNYRIYKLGARYLEPLVVSADSFLVLRKASNPSLHYAAAPLIGNREGVKSYTINYTLQGVDCYIRSFLSALVNASAELTLSLGTLYNIKKIVLEKFDGSQFKPIQVIQNIGLELIFIDTMLTKGLNTYRIKLELEGGGIVYSGTESVFYFGNDDYVLYPNPTTQYNPVKIAAQLVDNDVMQVFNSVGVKVYEKILNDRINIIPPGILSKGVYFLRFTRKKKQHQTLRLIVY